jgi:hypothetical protein
LPSKLKELEVASEYPHIDVLPHTLQSLKLRYYKYAISALPESLVYLEIECRHPLEAGMLPSKLKHLKLNDIRHPIPEGVFPESLVSLEIDTDHSCANIGYVLSRGILPSQLKIFKHCGEFRGIVDFAAFPSTIKHISFYESFNQPLEPRMLQEGLQILE